MTRVHCIVVLGQCLRLLGKGIPPPPPSYDTSRKRHYTGHFWIVPRLLSLRISFPFLFLQNTVWCIVNVDTLNKEQIVFKRFIFLELFDENGNDSLVVYTVPLPR